MGRRGDGVEIRGNSIRLSFTLEGVRRRELLMLNGTPMPPTAANLKYAHRLAQEIRDRIRFGTFSMAEYFPAGGGDGNSALTLDRWLDMWLDTKKAEKSTRAGYESAVRFWKSASMADSKTVALGDMLLRALRLSHLLAAIAHRPDLNGKTVNNYVSVLRQSMALALDDELIPRNPAEGIPPAAYQKVPPDPFTKEEAEAIIADMAAHYPEPIYNLVDAWFFIGWRTSEAFGLRWPNVDLRSRNLVVSETTVAGEHKDSTKTHVARAVMLNSRSLAAINRQAKHTRMAGEYVWLDPRYNKPWENERAFRRSYWAPTLKRLGIRYRRPYNMRHTYATTMLMAGMTPAFCAKQLGHSIEMFLRTYSKWLDGAQNDLEMNRLESALENSNLSQIRPKSGQS